jgi:hypothetical protein
MNTDLGEPYKFVVPFEAQDWMMQMMGDEMLYRLHAMIDTYRERIRAEMDGRFMDGYTHFGSEMYNWDDERRLKNIIEELADAAVYMTSGPLPPKPVV